MTALEKKLKKLLGCRYTGPLLSFDYKNFVLSNHDGNKIRVLARAGNLDELFEQYTINTGEKV